MSKLCEHWYINLTILSKHPWIYQNRWHAYKPFSKDVCVYMPHIHILRWWSWFFFNLGKPMCKSCVNECLKQSVQFSRSVVFDSATPWTACSMPGLPVHHQLLEFTQTRVHCFGDAIQPSHPLSSPSLPAFNLSQHQGLFKWVSSLHQVAKVLEFQLQHHSFQWIFRTNFL